MRLDRCAHNTLCDDACKGGDVHMCASAQVQASERGELAKWARDVGVATWHAAGMHQATHATDGMARCVGCTVMQQCVCT